MSEVQIVRPQEIRDIPHHLPPSLLRVISETQFDHAARRINLPNSVEPADLMGITAAISGLEGSIQPATVQQRKACLLALVAVYPPRDGGQDIETARFNIYHEALHDIPADVLWNACIACVKTIKFFPMPAEIIAASVDEMGRRRGLLVKLRGLRNYKRIRPEPSGPLSAEEAARRTKLVADLRKAAAGDRVTAEEQLEHQLTAAVIIVPYEPEISDLATAIVRARIKASKATELDIEFLKELALADARLAWPWLKARGWSALQMEVESV